MSPSRLLIAVLAIEIVACKGKAADKAATNAPVVDPKAAAEEKALADLAVAIKALPASTTQRAPLRDTPAAANDPRAATYYGKAMQDAKAAYTGDLKSAELITYFDKWPAAAPAMKELGASTAARDAAVSITTGAGAASGASPVAPGGDYAAVVGTAAAAIAAALESNEKGSAEAAAWQLLSTIRLGQDLARAATYESTDAGAEIIRMSAAALRTVATNADRKKFPTPNLAALLAGCQVARSTQPSYEDILVADLRVRGEALLATLAPAPDVSDGGAAPAPLFAIDADIKAAGSPGSLAQRLLAHIEAIDSLRADAPSRAAPRQERMQEVAKKAWGEAGHPSLDINRFGRWLLAGADLDGTCMVLALELDRRTRKKGELAPNLDALTPKPLEQPILDTLGDKAWEYVDDGFGGRILRSMPIVLDDTTATVEMRVTKRSK